MGVSEELRGGTEAVAVKVLPRIVLLGAAGAAVVFIVPFVNVHVIAAAVAVVVMLIRASSADVARRGAVGFVREPFLTVLALESAKVFGAGIGAAMQAGFS